LENSTDGGESIFLDSFNAIEILKNEAPADFDILCRVPVTFEYENDGHHLRLTRPTISPGTDYDRYVVRYSPPFQGPLENTDCKLTIQFYSSMKKFEEILGRKNLVFKTRLEPGDLVIFANQRVFHGREAFDPAIGHRHFRGTYVTNDDYRNRVRTNL
jgi:gamma-butyrobetaine dioxygenase